MDIDELVKATFLDLNKQFYNNFNPKYFTQKASFHLALLSDTSFLSKVYEEGIEIGEIKAKGNKLTTEEEVHLKEMLKTEISLIYYHSIETFFRLFIAHTFKSQCPWVEISSLTSYKIFKSEVEKIHDRKFPRGKDELKNVIALIMFGRLPSDITGEQKQKWNKNLSNLIEWIDLFSNDLLKNSDYNAYKHGLGIFTTEFGFELGDTPINRKKTEAVTYITQKKEGDTIRYFKTYKFLDWQQKTALIFLMSQMIENIISIGKHNFLHQTDSVKLHSFHDRRITDLFKDGFHTTEMSLDLPFAKKLTKYKKGSR